MAVPEKTLDQDIQALANRIAYAGGISTAGAFIVADIIVRLENRVQELERELAEVKYNPPHLRNREIRQGIPRS